MIRFYKERPTKKDWYPYIAFCGSKHFWNLFIGVIFGYINIFCAAKDWMIECKENGRTIYKRNEKYKDEKLIMFPSMKSRKERYD